ncbi:uncharacterized protein PAC_03897 [Phialocephala subalpina]|uniref:Uncharacterized protein n=1 Tax=Phialocephala subalpina TaxID=576137 RepID=A0A1L7WML1_9HELO|nr:uncharacterized protein PAC_03897 [Phialocephala subalpina]
MSTERVETAKEVSVETGTSHAVMAGTTSNEWDIMIGMENLTPEMAAGTNSVTHTSSDEVSPHLIDAGYISGKPNEDEVVDHLDLDQAIRRNFLDSGFIDESFFDGEPFDEQDSDDTIRQRILDSRYFDESYFQDELDDHLESESGTVSENRIEMTWLESVTPDKTRSSRESMERNEIRAKRIYPPNTRSWVGVYQGAQHGSSPPPPPPNGGPGYVDGSQFHNWYQQLGAGFCGSQPAQDVDGDIQPPPPPLLCWKNNPTLDNTRLLRRDKQLKEQTSYDSYPYKDRKVQFWSQVEYTSDPRPERPGKRALLAHEVRLLKRFFPIAKPSTPHLSTNEELEIWFDSWAIVSYNEDLYKSWERFRNENSTAAEKSLYGQSVDEHEAAVANFPIAMRAWNKHNNVSARHDSNLKAAQEAQIEEWGETEEGKREKWRLHGLNAKDAAEVATWLKPMRDQRLQAKLVKNKSRITQKRGMLKRLRKEINIDWTLLGLVKAQDSQQKIGQAASKTDQSRYPTEVESSQSGNTCGEKGHARGQALGTMSEPLTFQDPAAHPTQPWPVPANLDTVANDPVPRMHLPENPHPVSANAQGPLLYHYMPNEGHTSIPSAPNKDPSKQSAAVMQASSIGWENSISDADYAFANLNAEDTQYLSIFAETRILPLNLQNISYTSTGDSDPLSLSDIPQTLQKSEIPQKPEPRKPLDHEIRLLGAFYTVLNPLDSIPGTDTDLQNWWGSKKQDEDIWTQWNNFVEKRETEDEKTLRYEAIANHQMLNADYRREVRVLEIMRTAGA